MTYWVLVTHTFVVILRRLFMEMRVYEEVPPYRARSICTARALLGAYVAGAAARGRPAGLWWLTIIGGAIKTFFRIISAGFILAENPTMKGGDAIALSRKMMKPQVGVLPVGAFRLPWHLLSLRRSA